MVTREEAVKYLSDTSPEQSFWVNNGPVLRNLDELSNFIQGMPDDAYSYHANKDKNDFSRWINEIIGDKKLANDLLSSKSKQSAARKLNSRLAMLKKKVA